jgi:thiol-disulfide isomerase/thioredoxin
MNTPALRPALGVLALAALALGLGVWAGTKLYSSRGPEHSHRGIPVPAGEASPPNPSDLARDDAAEGPTPGVMPAAKIPERLPQFTLENRAGKATSISSFADKSLVINFWATWCAPCRSEIPLLEALNTEWAGRGVTVVGIAVDHRDKVLEFADRLKMNYPLLMGEQDALDVATGFGMNEPVFPFTVFTDRRGEVVALFVGELHRAQAELILAQVQGLNQDLIRLPAAQRAIAEGLRSL